MHIITALLLVLLSFISVTSKVEQLNCQDYDQCNYQCNDECGIFEYEQCFTLPGLGVECVTDFCCCWGQAMGGEYFK